jgi:hypothetical protein
MPARFLSKPNETGIGHWAQGIEYQAFALGFDFQGRLHLKSAAWPVDSQAGPATD